MFAIIETGGKQYLVKPGDRLLVERLKKKEGEEVVFDKVLLVKTENKVEIGRPFLENVKVKAKILGEKKGEKIVVLKYKPRRRYRVKRGHRQIFTEVEIQEIITV